MMAGGEVTLLPIDLDSGLQRGVITHWLTGAAGLVVTIGVRTSREAAAMCSGQRVWISGREAADEELIVLEVIARRASDQDDTTLILTGVLPLARERRRSAVRAATRHPEVIIELPGNKKFALAAEVMRIDRQTGELGMRFEPTELDLAPIDRLVYATVKRQKITEEY
jgi:hypothetical protein